MDKQSMSQAEFAPRRIAVAASLPFIVFFVAPFGFYFGNIEEFSFGTGEAFLPLFGGFIGASLFFYTALRFLSRWPYIERIAEGLVAALAVAVLLQSQIFVWDFGPLDGRGIKWEEWRLHRRFEAGIWVVWLIGALHFAKKYRSLPYHLSSFVLIAGMLSLVSTWVTSGERKAQADHETRIHKLHPKNNTIVVILDTFQSGAFAEILENHPEELERFDGFTYYRNAVGGFPTTYASIPLILTGQYYKNKQPISDFLSSTYKKHGVPRSFAKSKYGQAYSALVTKAYQGIEKYEAEVKDKNQLVREFVGGGIVPGYRIFDAGLFRALPTYFKPVIYNGGAWLISGLTGGSSIPTDHGTDKELATWLSKNMVVESENEGEFRLYHYWGAHSPLVLNQNREYRPDMRATWGNYVKQARGSLKNVRDMFVKMQDLGVYRDAEIVVLGDHGTRRFEPKKRHCGDRWNCGIEAKRHAAALPLFMYKSSGATGPVRVNDVPVSLADVPCFLGVGKDGEECLSGKDVTRHFYWYSWRHKYWKAESFPPITEYRVDGNAYDTASWRKTGSVFTSEGIKKTETTGMVKKGSRVSLVGPGSSIYTPFGWSVSEGSHRWTSAKNVGLKFNIEDLGEPEDIIFELSARPYLARGEIDGQEVVLTASGRNIGTWTMSGKAVYEAMIPASVIEEGRVELELNISDPIAPSEYGFSGDSRTLGVAVEWFRVRDRSGFKEGQGKSARD